jgi:chloramphenicol 3-O phosphotransferase
MAAESGPGSLLMLNGTSSAGKSTLARAIQRIADAPWLWTGLDATFAMVPAKWGGGEGGPLSFDGFRYDESERDDTGRPLVTIRYGPTGQRILEASHRAIVALVDAGQRVIVDEMLLSDDVLDDWLRALQGRDTWLVGVQCSLDRLEARERARSNRPGLARGHLRTVHRHGLYDFEVDTTDADPDDLARSVLASWARRGDGRAFDELRARLLPPEVAG